PRPHEVPEPERPKVLQSRREYTPREVLRTPAFWLLYVMMTMAATGGVMALAQLGPMSTDFRVRDVPVYLGGVALAALPFAQMLDRVLGGVTRPFFGWVSDHVGREKTMFVAFTLEGTALFLLARFGHDPVWFVLTSGLAFFGWGAAFSLFPALIGDMFGRKFATTNYSLLYTAKGTSALLVPLGNLLHDGTGSWGPVLLGLVAFDWTSALLALFVLRPLRARWAAAEAKRSV